MRAYPRKHRCKIRRAKVHKRSQVKFGPEMHIPLPSRCTGDWYVSRSRAAPHTALLRLCPCGLKARPSHPFQRRQGRRACRNRGDSLPGISRSEVPRPYQDSRFLQWAWRNARMPFAIAPAIRSRYPACASLGPSAGLLPKPISVRMAGTVGFWMT